MLTRYAHLMPLVATCCAIGAYIYYNKTIEDLNHAHRSALTKAFMEGWEKGYDDAKDDWTLKNEHYEELKALYK